jgi:hypothetical protein
MPELTQRLAGRGDGRAKGGKGHNAESRAEQPDGGWDRHHVNAALAAFGTSAGREL